MKKILTIAAIATIFASNFANASTIITANGGKVIFSAKVKTSKSSKAHYSKIYAKEFSVKKMQDTKDILMPIGSQPVADYFTTSAS
jgi:hypothetical protein